MFIERCLRCSLKSSGAKPNRDLEGDPREARPGARTRRSLALQRNYEPPRHRRLPEWAANSRTRNPVARDRQLHLRKWRQIWRQSAENTRKGWIHTGPQEIVGDVPGLGAQRLSSPPLSKATLPPTKSVRCRVCVTHPWREIVWTPSAGQGTFLAWDCHAGCRFVSGLFARQCRWP